MKKKLIFFGLIFSFLLPTNLSNNADAAAPIHLVVNGQVLNSNPVNTNGRILVPMRSIFEKLGADVSWNNTERSITANKGSLRVKLYLNKSTAYVNGKAVQMDVPAKSINGSTYVPTRWVSETLGYKVGWSQNYQTVVIGSTSSVSSVTANLGNLLGSTSSLTTNETKVVSLVNDIRKQHGLQALRINDHISDVARLKSKDLSDKNYFDHQSPTYGSPFEMMAKFNITYWFAGENIAAGQATPEEVVNDWMNSPGHRANILKPEFNTIGVGYASGGSYHHYWTQMFTKAR